MIDWIADFSKKFENDRRLEKLKEEKFHGYIKINFSDGEVIDLNKYQTIRSK